MLHSLVVLGRSGFREETKGSDEHRRGGLDPYFAATYRLSGGVTFTEIGRQTNQRMKKRQRMVVRVFRSRWRSPSRCCREAAKQIMSRLDYLRDPDYSGASSSGSAPGGFCRDQLFVAVVLLASAVSHLLRTSYGCIDTLKTTASMDMIYMIY